MAPQLQGVVVLIGVVGFASAAAAPAPAAVPAPPTWKELLLMALAGACIPPDELDASVDPAAAVVTVGPKVVGSEQPHWRKYVIGISSPVELGPRSATMIAA